MGPPVAAVVYPAASEGQDAGKLNCVRRGDGSLLWTGRHRRRGSARGLSDTAECINHILRNQLPGNANDPPDWTARRWCETGTRAQTGGDIGTVDDIAQRGAVDFPNRGN